MNKNCAECGMPCDDFYHPYEFCILYKAGVASPEAFVRRAAKYAGMRVRDIPAREAVETMDKRKAKARARV